MAQTHLVQRILRKEDPCNLKKIKEKVDAFTRGVKIAILPMAFMIPIA